MSRRTRGRTGNLRYHDWKLVQLDRLTSMGLASYNEYLHSDHWKAFRTAYYREHPRKCVVCGFAGDRVVLHHKTYDRLGAEHPEDVIPLCDDCHQKTHNLVDKGEAFLDVAHLLIKQGRRKKATRSRTPSPVARCATTSPSPSSLPRKKKKPRRKDVLKQKRKAAHELKVARAASIGERKRIEAEHLRRERLGVLWTVRA